LVLLKTVPSAGTFAQSHFTDTISLNGLWKFKTDLYKKGMEEKWYSSPAIATAWAQIEVPGNWDTKNEYAHYTGDAWYSTTFKIPTNMQNKHIRLAFESVYNEAEVWLNGRKIGDNNLGFLAFQFNINSYIKYGANNTLVLKVNNQFKRGAIWNWGGIRRPVWLEVTNPLRVNHIAIDAVPNLDNGTAEIKTVTEIANYSNTSAIGSYSIDIYYKGRMVSASGKKRIAAMKAGDTATLTEKVSIDAANVHLWHFEHPELYEAEIKAYRDEKLVHVARERFGIRKIEVDGFKLKLNGQEIRTVGFNLVPEDRVYGNSLPIERIKTTVDLMKECGANMARLSHLALPKEFLDYLDEKGIMTFEEVSLWGKDTLVDPSNPLPKIWLKKLIRQRYNHPSIIGWSVGNEIGSFKNNPLAYEYVKGAIAMAKQLNPNRLATYASNTATSQPNDPAALCDIIFVNSYGNWGKVAEIVHKNFPTKLVFFAEYGNELSIEHLDNATIPIDKMLGEMRNRPYVVGASLWTFNDYRSNYWSAKNGWSTAPSENRTWGVVNSFLKPKKTYYELTKHLQPFTLEQLTVVTNHQTCKGQIRIKSRDLLSFPSFEISGYHLNVVSKTKDGNALSKKTIPIPTLNPGELSPEFRFEFPVDFNTAAASIQIVDALGYNRYDTVIFFQKPSIPKILGLHKNLEGIRLVFEKDPMSSLYYVKYGTGALDHTSDTASLSHFIEVNNLHSDSTYSLQLFAANNVGVSATSVETFKLESTEFPPVVWCVEPGKESFYVSYESNPLDFKYEIEYGTKHNQYEKRLMLENKGVLQIPGLNSNQKYFFRMRRLLQWGFASSWTNEMEVITR
jgi:hypothetical protein